MPLEDERRRLDLKVTSSPLTGRSISVSTALITPSTTAAGQIATREFSLSREAEVVGTEWYEAYNQSPMATRFLNSSRLLTVIPPVLALLFGACGRSNTTVIRGLDDARHARIGVMTGTTGEAIAKARFPEAEVKSFDDITDAVAAMKSGQLEAIVTAYPTALEASKKDPDVGPLAEPLAREDTSVALRKGNEELLAALNRIISGLRSDGTLESMKKRWFKPDPGPYEEPEIAMPREGTPLRIGVSATREPFSFVDKDGRVTGHDGELARIIASKLGRPIEFSNMKFMALIPALQSGKVDMIVTGMTATRERKQFVDFSEPYFENSQVMLVGKSIGPSAGSVRRLVSAADISDKRIGVLLGSAHDSYATKNFPHAKVFQYGTAADIALAVKTGKVDVALYDEVPLRDILRNDPALGLLGESLFSFPVGAGFSRDSDELRRSFNRFLAEIKRNGVHAGMVDRWIRKRESRMPDIAPSKSRGVIVIGLSTGEMPFGFVQNGQLLGFDIELARRFGAFVGKDVKFSDMEFGGLIAAVAARKVDMIAASIFITGERKKQVNFSEPYYEMGSRIFGLKSNIAAYGAQPPTEGASGSFLTSLANSFRSNVLEEKRYLLIWDGLKSTVTISIFATLFGTLLGAIVCFMRMSGTRLLRVAAKVYIGILRGTPVLVLLMLIFYVVFASVDINPLVVAVIAFGMNFAAYVSEIFRTGIEGVDKGQTEAGIAMGFSRVQTFLYVVLPQMVRRILPVYKGEFISLVKMTSIVGYIAVQDLTKASDIIRSRTFDAFFPLVMVALLYLAISLVLIQSLGYLERITDPKYRRRKAGLA
jgi:polar amino acid transport system substrate-binding protein